MVGPLRGTFTNVATCAKALYAHLRHYCTAAPPIPRRRLERIVANEVKDATDAIR
jgi:hypothetical protein